MGGSKKSTVGYWYRPSFLHAICQGPIDALVRIWGAEVEAWRGRQTANSTITIDKVKLWGGDSSEGGIQGDMDLMFGASDQSVNTAIATQLGASDASAHRGIFTSLWKGGRFGAMNPYPKALRYLVERILAGWQDDTPWYPEKAPVELVPIQTTPVGSPYIGISFTDTFKWITTGATTDYSSPSFDDSSWASGAGIFEGASPFPNEPIASASVGTNLTNAGKIWLRKTFTVSQPSLLTFDLYHDDAGELWVNGVSVPLTPVTGYWQSSAGPILVYPGTISVAYRVTDSIPTPITAAGLSCEVQPVTVSGFYSINPAHVIYDALTNDLMQGEPTALLSSVSFTSAADTLFDEGFGICTTYNPEKETVEQFIQRICAAIGGTCTRDPTTGQWHLDLARGDYTLASLPILTDDDILEWEEEPWVVDDAVNEVRVKWFNVDLKQEATTVPLQALGAIDAAGRVNSQTLDHMCVPLESLAQRIAARELRSRATPLQRFKFKTTRKPYSWRVGTYFRLQAPDRGIADMVCLIGDIDRGTLKSGAIAMTAIQDVFAMPDTVYVEGQTPIEPPSTVPEPAVAQIAIEAPYAELSSRLSTADMNALDDDAAYLLVAGAAPEVGPNYELETRISPADYESAGSYDWCPTALVVESANKVQTTFTLSDASLIDRVSVGTSALWGAPVGSPESYRDYEIVRVDAIDATLLTVTLARGCMDTVPQEHAAGERIWFIGEWATNDNVEYVTMETADVKLLSNTGTDVLPLAEAPVSSVTFDQRAFRPYPPAALTINGEQYPDSVNDTAVVEWLHRDRLAQGDQIIDQTAASIGPEYGTRYDAWAYDNDTEDLLDSVSGIAGTSWTPALLDSGTVRVEVAAVRDAIESWQRHTHTFDFVGVDGRVTEDDEAFTTEDGVVRTTE